jgi:hypothetical protein
MKKISLLTGMLFILPVILPAQESLDIIINEIGNNGTKNGSYTGSDYIEFLIQKETGISLAGWYLTDLSSPSGTAKEKEGSIKFSDKEGSVFRQIIPRGTYIVICFGQPGDKYGDQILKEDVSITDGNNRIVVFAYSSPQHIEPQAGTIQFTGKDNIALVSDWTKRSAVCLVTWGGSSSWEGCPLVELPLEYGENGKIMFYQVPKQNVPATSAYTNSQNWISTTDETQSSPGEANKPGTKL